MDLDSLKVPAEVISSKIKAFKNCLELAIQCLTNRDFSNAEIVYGSILADLHKGCFRGFMCLNELDVFSLHICFAYASVGANCQSESVLIVLNRIDTTIKLPLLHYLKAFVHVANDRFSFALDDLQNCESLLKNGYNFKPNDHLNETIVPEINDEVLKKKIKGLKVFCKVLGDRDEIEIKESFIQNWLKLGTLSEADKLSSHIDFKQLLQEQEQNKAESKNTGAVKKTKIIVKTKSSKCMGIQTETLKRVNVAVQTSEKNVLSQIFNTVTDIKSKMNSYQNKKETEIKQLQKKNSELTEKLLTYENLQKQADSSEFDFLKNQYLALEKKYDESQKQIELLQKIFTEQLQHKFFLQKNIYRMFVEKCEYKIDYLCEIQKFLQPGNIVLSDECGQEAFMWKKSIEKIIEERNNFDIFYKSIDNSINNKQFLQINAMDWPGLPLLQNDVNDLIHRNFKSMIQQGKAIAVPPYHNFNTMFNKYGNEMVNMNGFENNYAYKQDGRTTGSPQPVMRNQDPIASHYIERKPPIMNQQNNTFFRPGTMGNNSSVTPNVSSGRKFESYWSPGLNPNANLSNNSSFNSFRTYWGGDNPNMNPGDNSRPNSSINPTVPPERKSNSYDSEHELLKYLHLNFEDVDEMEVFEAVYLIRDANGGTLKDFPPPALVKEIKKYFKKKKNTTKTWNTLNKNQWQNNHTENKCVICFDEFNATNSYSLSCQHEFHRTCITTWLKRQGACPICRVHAVIDEDFPPLKK